MTHPRRNAGYSGVTALLLTCVACTSLQDLSSYSARSSDASQPSSLQTPDAETLADPLEPTPDAGGGAASAVEAPDPADVTFIPSGTGTAGDAAIDCTGPGEFTDAAATSCYRIGDDRAGWDEARDTCRSWGGDLAQISSVDENTLLAERTEQDAWLGASDADAEGVFRWIGGDDLGGDDVDPDGPWAFAQPDNYEGSENCLELRQQDDRWNDAPCLSPKLASCERSLVGAR